MLVKILAAFSTLEVLRQRTWAKDLLLNSQYIVVSFIASVPKSLGLTAPQTLGQNLGQRMNLNSFLMGLCEERLVLPKFRFGAH